MAEGSPARLQIVRSGAHSVVSAAFAQSPLRLLTPRNHGSAAWAYTSTFGGGLVGGDALLLDVEVSAGARAFLSTQGATRIYRGARGCRAALRATVGEGALFVSAPDPVSCFADAAYGQRTEVTLAAGASVVLADALTAGRTARGERWALRRYSSALRVVQAGKTLLDEALLLDPAHGPLRERFGRFDALATVLLAGPSVAAAASALRERAAALPVEKGAEVIESASALPGGALLLRLAATSAERLVLALRARLSFLPALLGDDPFARRW